MAHWCYLLARYALSGRLSNTYLLCFDSYRLRLINGLGQSRNAGSVEDSPHRNFNQAPLPQAADDLGGQQGMAAEVEEIVVGADLALVAAQHFGPDFGNGLFRGRAGGDVRFL